MQDWPKAWFELLDDIASRTPAPPAGATARDILSTRIGRQCLTPVRGLNGIPLTVIASTTHAWLKTRHNCNIRKGPATIQNSVALLIGRAMPAGAIAKHLGVRYYFADFRRIYQQTLDIMAEENVSGSPEALGAELLERVTQQWLRLERTVPSFEASEMIEGLARERRLTGWDHPSLIMPASEFNQYAKKRKSSYHVEDVSKILNRIKEFSLKVDDTNGLHHLTTDLMRRTLTPYYTKTQFLLDIFSRHIPTYRTVDHPRLCDLYAKLDDTRCRGSSYRAIGLFQADAMLQARPLNNMIELQWGEDVRLKTSDSRLLREAEKIRFEETIIWNKTEKRFHVNYRYSVRDTLHYFKEAVGSPRDPDLNVFLENSIKISQLNKS